jgi:hypothetical protein
MGCVSKFGHRGLSYLLFLSLTLMREIDDIRPLLCLNFVFRKMLPSGLCLLMKRQPTAYLFSGLHDSGLQRLGIHG